MTAALADLGANILTSEQTADDNCFDLRVEFELERPTAVTELEASLNSLRSVVEGQLTIHDVDHDAPVAILLSKFPHCLLDLLARWRIGDLPGHPVVVISNHPDHQDIAESAGLPFHHLPVTAGTKLEQEARIDEVLVNTGAELAVMARYMQILSDGFIARNTGRIINIHHSFLPAFPGARPYHQARERGVKIIGATAHYATADLDEGPIITQDIARVTHRESAEDMVRIGRELENRVLAAAVRAHLHHKVIVRGRRTVVFA